jgi:hypothetical protein
MNILIIFYLVKFGREPDMDFFILKKNAYIFFRSYFILNFDD